MFPWRFLSVNRVLLILLAGFWLAMSVSAPAAYDAYLPMSQAEYGKKFPLEHLLTMPGQKEAYDRFQSQKPELSWRFPKVGVSGATLKLSKVNDDDQMPAEWVLQGKDKNNKPWSVYTGQLTEANVVATEIFQADLDRNGINDLIIWAPNFGCGLAPSSVLEIITFDNKGRPCLLETWGYDEDESYYDKIGKKWVNDLLNLKDDGRAQLLTMQFDDGYWITDLYQVEDARWQKVEGKFGELSYPVMTRFTHRPNKTITHTIKPGRHPVAANLSNGPQSNKTIYKLTDESGEVFQAVENEQVLTGTDIDSVLVIDNQAERTIMSSTADTERRKKAFQDLFTSSRKVFVYGSKPYSPHGPITIWTLSEK